MAIDVDSDTFEKEVLQSEVPVLVDFWGPQCAPLSGLDAAGGKDGGHLRRPIKNIQNRRLQEQEALFEFEGPGLADLSFL